MEKIYRAYPDDLDAAAFYSLSLLGLVNGPGTRVIACRRRRARSRSRFIRRTRTIPARRTTSFTPSTIPITRSSPARGASLREHRSRSASRAPHAVAHFSATGNVARGCGVERVGVGIVGRVDETQEPFVNVRDYHSLHWLLYAYLQQGRYRKAEELLKLMKKVMSESTYDNKLRPGLLRKQLRQHGRGFVVETERWNLANELFPESQEFRKIRRKRTGDEREGHGKSRPAPATARRRPRTSWRVTLPLFVRGLAAVGGSSVDLLHPRLR
jgi:hypothetical protein